MKFKKKKLKSYLIGFLSIIILAGIIFLVYQNYSGEMTGDAVRINTNRLTLNYQPNWPQTAAGGIISSPVFYDLDGDGKKEVIIGSDKLYVWHENGTLMKGWPRGSVYPVGRIDFSGSPAVGDVDGDGEVEIVDGETNGFLYVWKKDGTLLYGWPKKIVDGELGIQSAPVLADLNNDKKLEIIVASNFEAWREEDKNFIFVLNYLGQNLLGWPKKIGAPGSSGVRTSALVLDMDKDGSPEIIQPDTGDNNVILAWHLNGSIVSGWPFSGIFEGFTPASSGLVLSIVGGDLNNDGFPEIVATSAQGFEFVLDRNGDLVQGWPQNNPARQIFDMYSKPVLSDLNNDGFPEIIATKCVNDQIRPKKSLGCTLTVKSYNGTSLIKEKYFKMGSTYDGGYIDQGQSPAVADINGDGSLEIIAGAVNFTGGYLKGDTYIYIWNSSGDLLKYSPTKFEKTLMTWSSPAIDDIDNDGKMEMAFASLSYAKVVLVEFPWNVNQNINKKNWWSMYQRDVRHTGIYYK